MWRRHQKKKNLSGCDCVRARERIEISPAPQSALHFSTGPQWIQSTVEDYIYNVRYKGGFVRSVFHRSGRLEGLSTKRIHCLGFSLRSSLTCKWDAGYAASPVIVRISLIQRPCSSVGLSDFKPVGVKIEEGKNKTLRRCAKDCFSSEDKVRRDIYPTIWDVDGFYLLGAPMLHETGNDLLI